MVMYCGIILAAVGLYLLPVWTPLFGIGIALTWLGALQVSFETMFGTRNRISWRHLVMGATLLIVVLYIVIVAVLDYGHSLPQRIAIVVATITLQAIIILTYKKSDYKTAASSDLAATGPKHDER